MISDILDKCWLMIKNGVDMCPFLLGITHNPFSWNPEENCFDDGMTSMSFEHCEKSTPGSRHTIGIPSLQAQVFGSSGKSIPGEVISCNEWGKRLRHLVMCLVEETISSLAMGRVLKRLSSVELT